MRDADRSLAGFAAEVDLCERWSGIGVEMNVVCAGVRTTRLVGDPLDICFRNQVTEVVEFAGAGLRILIRNGPDGAIVEVDPKVPFSDCFEVGEVTLFVEEFGENGDLLGDGLACEPTLGDIDHLVPPTIEDSANEGWLFGFHVPEELDR